ncbi:hypothetical protein QP414_04275 [Corynebacterium simulans]|uniref:hypothetical protein n=1 Tax=Corynebacterium simulans TaxID=146827 RepID=UPI00254B7656|nr:hypothetical protein [Corynebacterium simulans]MDK7138526.1 hypothetical protein [Corynebacterium simulans]
MENKQNSDDVLEALNFETQVNKQANHKQTLLNTLSAIVLPCGIVGFSLFPRGIWAAVFFAVYLILVIAAVVIVQRGKKTRPAVRQDPFSQPKADNRYWIGTCILLCPIIVHPFLRDSTVAVVVFAIVWGCGIFWALQSGALDLQKRAVGNA